MMVRISGLLLILFLFPATANLLPGAAASTDNFLYSNYTHKDHIGAVVCNKVGWTMAPPIIRLGSDEQIELHFDDLDADYKNYQYTLVHCNADWTPSLLQPYEYLDGFYEDMIHTYARSFNTLVIYSNYTLVIPNENIRPKISGNYILKVFLSGNPDDVVITRRIMVFEQLTHLTGSVNMANLIAHRDTRQQLEFTIHSPSYTISNPLLEMKVVVTQNGRWDNALWGLTPRSMMGNAYVYDYEEEMLFDGGNEFRRFDTRSLRFVTERVADIQSSHSHWDVFLLADQNRRFRQYASDDDINGRFLIKNNDGRNDMLESDYAWVHFSLPADAPMAGGSLYVMGELTEWQFTDKNKMHYNYREKKYELQLLLKQGYYNYLYAFVADGSSRADLGMTEGNHSVAGNEYSIFVYHRQPGTMYDGLVGITHLNTTVR